MNENYPLRWHRCQEFVDHTGDPREWHWLHQYLSLAMGQGNATRILKYVVS